MKLTLDDGKKLRALHINRIEMGYDDDKELGKGYFLKMYGDFIVQTGYLKQGYSEAWFGPRDTFMEVLEIYDEICEQYVDSFEEDEENIVVFPYYIEFMDSDCSIDLKVGINGLSELNEYIKENTDDIVRVVIAPTAL